MSGAGQTARPCPGDRRRDRGQSTREALVAAALHLFGEHGFDGTSTRAIARASGCNIGLIAFHFQSKEGLYREVRERLKGQLRSIIQPVAESLGRIDAAGMAEPAMRREVAGEIRRILAGMLEHAGDQSWFLLLRRSLRAGDDEAAELYGEVFLPLFRALEGLLNATRPGRAHENGLRAFLAIDAAVAVLRDYPDLYVATGHAVNPAEDVPLMADIVCGVLWGGADPGAEG